MAGVPWAWPPFSDAALQAAIAANAAAIAANTAAIANLTQIPGQSQFKIDAIGTASGGSEQQTIAAGGAAFYDLPGPAAGFIRIYNPVDTFSAGQAINTGPALYTLQPGNTSLGAGAVAGPTGVASVIIIGPGESIRVVNSNALQLMYLIASYEDLPNDGRYGLIRQAIGASPGATLIPAPAAGRYRRWFVGLQGSVGSNPPSYRAWVSPVNRDTIVHTIDLALNSRVVGRSLVNIGVGTQSLFNLDPYMRVTATTGPLTGYTNAPIVTTQPLIYGCYVDGAL